MANYQLEKQDGFAIIHLDQEGEALNTVSPKLMADFNSIFKIIQSDNEIKAVILYSAKKDFIVGADIKMFGAMPAEEMKATVREGHVLMEQVEQSKKPFIAAINGACMGAGLEISLACAGRVASDHKSTVLALPEVRLGLLPGLGGTQRLPRLIGIPKALPMMLTGQNIYPSRAKKMGLVDVVASKESLIAAAKKLGNDILSGKFKRKSKLSFTEKLLQSTGFTRNIIFKKAGKLVQRQTYGNYPAPPKILEAVQYGFGKSLNKGLEHEASLFTDLIETPESKQLINIFFGMTALKKNPMQEQVRAYKTVAMLGAGLMGAGITEVSINKGVDVILKDISEESIAKAKAGIWKSYEKKIKYKAMSRPEAEKVLNKITGQTDYQHFEKVNIVIEAVFEDLDLKHRIIKETEAAIRPDCIFASNTSALPIGAIAAKSARPENVIGMHYFSPVQKMPLLEIVVTDQTADWVTATCLDLGIKQGKTCIVVKDGPGFYTTRILAPYLNEALLLLGEGAKIEQIDKALKRWGFPVGPITLMDEVGIDVGAHVQEGELRTMFMERGKKYGLSEEAMEKQTSDVMGKLAAAGYKGRKNKKGFLQYDEKGKKIRGKVNGDIYDFFGGSVRQDFSDETIQERMALSMVNEAVLCLEESILRNPLDGDIGAIFGLGFAPFRGGPFRYIDAVGAKTVLSRLLKLEETVGTRFKPAAMLVDYAEQGKLFYEE